MVLWRHSATMQRKVNFCCDASRNMYEDYYTNQGGGEMPVFVGAKRQRGHGLGSMLSGLFRSVVMPFLNRNSGALIGNVLKTGAEMVGDLVRGKPFKQSLKERMPKAIKTTAGDINWQSGSGKPKRKRRRRRNDIFD